MKIYVKENWSEQFIYGDIKTPGFFVGRKHERQALKSIIENNDSSSILISGIRGTGKTSFVHKTLAELDNDKYIPVFVNLGHILSHSSLEHDDKKLFIKALIRSLYLNDFFNKNENEELRKLYKESLGVFKKVEEKEDKQEDEKSFSIKENIFLNRKNILLFLSILFFAIGISLKNDIARTILSIVGLGVFTLTITWKKEWTKTLLNRETSIIDNSTEYLEIELEKWLKKINEKKKIIFVIDELDKIEEKEVFNFIKEFKNLFTRAFAHFIFISGEQAFDLSNKNRQSSIEEGGHYPTFFTHVFYLPLPSEKEIREYLNEILHIEDVDNEYDEIVNNLINYLLFVSGNDFFALKRLILDLLFYDENNKPYLDVNEIKNSDPYFKDKSKLFKYVTELFVNYNWSKLKKNWKENSEMQKTIFDFLNTYYPNSFFDTNLNNPIEKQLADELVRIGHYKKREIDIAEKEELANLNIGNGSEKYIYECTFDFNRSFNEIELREEENEFNENFRELIRIANVLDDLPEAYNDDNKFSKEETKVYKGRDGSEYSGINLYATYSNFVKLADKLKKERTRFEIRREDIIEANKRILEQINLVYKQYWQALINLLIKILPDNVIKHETLNNVVYLFHGLPLINHLRMHENRVFRNNSRIVILLKEFEDFDSLNDLKMLADRKDILIVNVGRSGEFNMEPLEIQVEYKDKIGRRRVKKQKLENFINVYIGDVKDFSVIMKLVEKHLQEE